MEIPTTNRPVLNVFQTLAIIVLAQTIIILSVRGCSNAPGATPAPGAYQVGKVEILRPGGLDRPKKSSQHNVYFSDREHKLIPRPAHTRTHTRTNRIFYCYPVLGKILFNIILIISHQPAIHSLASGYPQSHKVIHIPYLETDPSWESKPGFGLMKTKVLGVEAKEANRNSLILVLAIIQMKA